MPVVEPHTELRARKSLYSLKKAAYQSKTCGVELSEFSGEREGLLTGIPSECSVPEDRASGGPTHLSSLRTAFLGSYLNVFLVFVVLGIVAANLNWSQSFVFVFNFLAILPLAQLLGAATEEVALRTNETVGGLLNATFGNATELIISIFGLIHELYRVVQVSLLGSILSNQLLVMGCCFLFGGIKYKEQKFNPEVAGVYGSLLLMAVLGLSVPSAYRATSEHCDPDCPELEDISRATALILLLLYVAMLVFQLYTHHDLMENNEPGEEEEPTMTFPVAIGLLLGATVMVAVCSEYLVDSIDDVAQEWDLSEMFIGLILLPIVGNAAEHATAVTVAYKNKMDLAVGVALGSSIQIALSVIPLLVIVAWIMDLPLNLDFHTFETVVLVVSVFVVNSVIVDGASTWLEGAMLLGAYLIIAITYYYRDEGAEVDNSFPYSD